MSFSQTAGTSIIPTLSRLVLGIAFLTVGFNKVFTDATYTADDAARLRQMGIEVEPIASDAAALATPRIQLASFEEQEADDTADDKSDGSDFADVINKVKDAAEEVGETAEEIADDVASEAQDEIDGASDGAAQEGGTAASMYHLALIIDEAGWKWPKYMAILAALTEFVGGGLLLIGFLSRIWGLGLAIAMGCAFYLTTMQGMNAPPIFSENPFVYVRNIDAFNMASVQLAFLVLALGITLTGPGPLSLDRLFFGGKKSPRQPASRVERHPPRESAMGSEPADDSNAQRPL